MQAPHRVLLYAADRRAAAEEVKAEGGRVLLYLSDRMLVASFPDRAAAARLQAAATTPSMPLDSREALLAAAWEQAEQRQEKAAAEPAVSWDAAGHEHPRNPGNDPDLAQSERDFLRTAEILGFVPTASSTVLRGSVTMGVYVVSGPGEALTFSQPERTQALIGPISGAIFLAEQEPRATISFDFEFVDVSVDAPDAPTSKKDQYFTFQLAGALYLFWQNAAGWAAIRPITYDAAKNEPVLSDINEVWSEIWNPDYTIYMPFTLGGQQYFLTANTVNGNVNIREIIPAAGGQPITVSPPAWQVDGWNPDYTVYMPFILGDEQYFLTANTANGNANIRRIAQAPNGQISVSDPVWHVNGWNPNYTVYMPFMLGSDQYFLTANTVNGYVNIRRITQLGSDKLNVSDPVWQKHWNPAYTVYMPFTLAGEQYFLTANTVNGNINIRQITRVDPDRLSVSGPLWEVHGWNPDYHVYVPFQLAGNQYFLTANIVTGNVIIRQISSASPGHPTVGKALYDAAWTLERAEGAWRNAALQQLGFGPGQQGVLACVNALRQRKKTSWAYATFLVKYTLGHFAYARRPACIMSYFNNGYGPEQIGTVFAHETCHVFGASDEYKSSKCSLSTFSYYKVPNRNCVLINDHPAQCLMDRNAPVLCNWSRGQLGWLFFSSVMPFQRGGRQWILSQDSSLGHACVQEIAEAAAPNAAQLDVRTPAWVHEWNPDYTVYMPFVLADAQYFLTANTANGNINIRRITLNASNSLEVSGPVWEAGRWNPNYTRYMPFVLGGNQYFLAANTANGNVNIRRITQGNGPDQLEVSKPVWQVPKWNPEYTVYMPFVLGANQYFLTSNPVNGNSNIRRVRQTDNPNQLDVDDPVWQQEAQWKGYTAFIPFVLGSDQYFLMANTVNGDIEIRRIARRRYRPDPDVTDPVWQVRGWNPNYTLYAPFTFKGVQYFISVNNAQGRMNIRPIVQVGSQVSVEDPVWMLP